MLQRRQTCLTIINAQYFRQSKHGKTLHLPQFGGRWFCARRALGAGSRDRTLADDPDLDYMMDAEILFLIETLETNGL